jgi:thiol:disulfide interchange protein DsbD
LKRILLLLSCLLLALPALAQLKLGGGTDDLLEPEKAFRFAARALDASTVEVSFDIAGGYYMYRERFKFAAEGNPQVKLGAAGLPPGIPYKDQFFGEMQIYRKAVRILVPVEGEGRFDLKVTSQGCADVGVCYVPMESTASLRVSAGMTSVSEAPRRVDAVPRLSIFASDVDIARLFEGNLLLVLGSFFAFGILLTFTPCVLPMIPILSGIIAGEGRSLNRPRALALSLSYVLGMAVAYAAAGIAAAFSGSLLAAALQNAWVLGAFALVFVVLALSMFGFYELRLPGFLHDRLH